jgi:hypothetical protein
MRKQFKTEITIVPREIITRALEMINAKKRIPDNFRFLDALPDLTDKIGKKQIFVLWNDGDLRVSETGGRDCIASLRRVDGIIKGWSI